MGKLNQETLLLKCQFNNLGVMPSWKHSQLLDTEECVQASTKHLNLSFLTCIHIDDAPPYICKCFGFNAKSPLFRFGFTADFVCGQLGSMPHFPVGIFGSSGYI